MPLQLRQGRRLGGGRGGGGGGGRIAQVGRGRATRETEEEQMKETAVYKWQACIAHRLPLREGLMRSLSSFKAPEPAAMHKETQTSSFSHTHTYAHQCQSAASCWRGCNGTLCVSMPAWACQPELMIFESKCSGSEDLWEQTCENHSNMGSWCQSNQLVYY